MLWCECNDVDYMLGLAKNERLKREIIAEIEQAEKLYQEAAQAGVSGFRDLFRPESTPDQGSYGSQRTQYSRLSLFSHHSPTNCLCVLL
jgi:hypothetical protein